VSINTMTQTTQTVVLDIRDAVAEVTLNRPHRRNAIDHAMREELCQMVRRIETDPGVRAVILRGEGGHFCSGGDIAAVNDDKDAASKRRRLIDAQRTVGSLLALECPVIAVGEGAVYGAGLGIALTADFILATPESRFGCSFLRIGLVPDFGVFYTLPRVVGLQRAKELIFSAREFRAEEAKEMGLVMEVHPAASVLQRARAIAAAFACASPVAMSLAKRALGRSLETDLSAMLAFEADAQGIAFSTGEAKQALQRFLSKQPPLFSWPAAD
jgi:2-(1,2-epoxy-1,2-dihydrophenyl)acetyl-CoA isomerase